MQFERIRKSHKRKIIIGGLILVCVISAITITTTRAKYKLTQDIPLVRGTINYKAYDFKIMAMYQSEDGSNYKEIENRMPASGYVINEEKSYCTLDNKNKDTNIRLYTNSNGEHIFSNLAATDKCYLYFDKYVPPITNVTELIAAVNPKTGAPTFSNIATSDEGVYKVSDPVYGGYSYYWRGAVTNNYVKFAGFCWRIVRINGDESIRLIYDGATCHANGTRTAESIAKTNIQYNTSNNKSNYAGWTYTGTSQRTLGGTASNAKTQLESWYNSNIGNNTTYSAKVADGKYCNDRNAASGYTWTINGSFFNYAGNKRLYTDYAPTLSCNSGDVYTLKVGLITADEVMYAGGKKADNNSYYLYNGQHYWTMTPSTSGDYVNVFCVNMYGYLSSYLVNDTTRGLRPVINLKADTQFQAGGNGTINSPYVVQ